MEQPKQTEFTADEFKRVVIHHRRDENGRIEVQILHDGSLVLDPPGLNIAVQEIFVGL